MVVNQAKHVMFVLARSTSVRRYIELVGLTELDVPGWEMRVFFTCEFIIIVVIVSSGTTTNTVLIL